MLKELQEMVDDLTSTNSNNEKIDRLKKYSHLKKVIEYAHNPMKQFYVTSKNIKKHNIAMEFDGKEEDLFPILDDLSARIISGHDALEIVYGYVKKFQEYEDIIYSIIDKNLKIRMSDTTINKVFPGLIPEFKVQLADKFDANKVPNFEKEEWYSSRKLDGVRCITIVKNNNINFFSRTGKEFYTLDKVREAIKEDLKNFYNGDYVLDGEMCIVDEKGNEDFTAMIKLIRKKNFTIDNPRYKIFDVIPLEDFLNKKGDIRFYIRYEACQKIKSKSGILDPVKQVKIKNEEHFTELTAEASEKGWEGLIIRKNVFYEGKRTKKMLKVKQFHDAEYEVTGVVNEAVRYISKETGLEKEEMMLSSVVIEHEGNRVNVGSGFSLEQRQAFFKDSSLIIGKTITVKYFEESQDKDGKKSLRFPVVKHIFEEKRDV